MLGVTRISDVVGTLVLTFKGNFELVRRVHFAQIVFDSGDKDG